MKLFLSYCLAFLVLSLGLPGAVTDVVLPQRNTATTFTSRTITGSTNVGKALGFGPGGLLEAIDVAGNMSTNTLWDAAGDLVVGTGNDAAARLPMGTALQVLRVNAGATALEWAAAPSGSPGGSDTFVQYNNATAFGGEAGFTYDATTNTLSVPASTISTTLNAGTAAVTLGTISVLPTTTIELGHAFDTTLARGAAGRLTVSGITMVGTSTPDTLTNKILTLSIVQDAEVVLDQGALILPQGMDPDVTDEGQISYDTNNDVLRVHDGTNQIAIGRKIEAIHCTVISPNDLADSERDAFWMWENVSGMAFVVTGWSAKSDTDDTTLNIEEINADGTNNVTVDAVEIATNGTGLFTGADTTITAATIEDGHLLVLDFDDTDTPGQVKTTVYGYYNADIGGGAAWIDVETVANTDTSGVNSVGASEWTEITVPSVGSATKARIYSSVSTGSGGLKMALYSADGSTLLADGVVAITGAEDAAYIEVTFTAPAAVVAANYILAWSTDSPDFYPRYKNGVGTHKLDATQPYAGFPYTPVGTETHSFSRNHAVSLYVE